MTEPTYGSGQYDQPGQGYGGGQGYGQPQPQYGGPHGGGQYGGPAGQPGPGGPPGYQTGYPSGSTPPGTPSRAPTDRAALIANIITIIGYVCFGGGLLSFILQLTINYGDGTAKFANALQALILGIGFGGLNVAAGTWLASRKVD